MRNKNIGIIRGFTAIFWLGFFMAISFMEAPLKFTASHLSMAAGLQIGKIVFGALNYCEWAFLTVLIVTLLIKKPAQTVIWLIAALGGILILETAWLLPLLDADANRIIAGETVTGHNLHWCYVLLEVIKIPVLVLIGLNEAKGLITK